MPSFLCQKLGRLSRKAETSTMTVEHHRWQNTDSNHRSSDQPKKRYQEYESVTKFADSDSNGRRVLPHARLASPQFHWRGIGVQVILNQCPEIRLCRHFVPDAKQPRCPQKHCNARLLILLQLLLRKLIDLRRLRALLAIEPHPV